MRTLRGVIATLGALALFNLTALSGVLACGMQLTAPVAGATSAEARGEGHHTGFASPNPARDVATQPSSERAAPHHHGDLQGAAPDDARGGTPGNAPGDTSGGTNEGLPCTSLAACSVAVAAAARMSLAESGAPAEARVDARVQWLVSIAVAPELPPPRA